MSVSCDPGNYAKKKNVRSQFGKMASTSYSAVEVFDLLDTDSLATRDQAERRETTARAIGGPVYQGWWTRPRQL